MLVILNHKLTLGEFPLCSSCDIIVSKFELQSYSYSHFWLMHFCKDMKPLVFLDVGSMVSETEVQSQVKSYQRLKK